MFNERLFLSACLGLVLAVPRGASAEHTEDEKPGPEVIILTSGVAAVFLVGSVVTVIGNGVTYPSHDEPVSPSAKGWAIADIVFGSLDVAVSIAAFAMFPGEDKIAFSLGFGLPMLAIGATGIGLGASALHRLPGDDVGLRVLPLPFVGTAPGGEVYGGLSFVGVGW